MSSTEGMYPCPRCDGKFMKAYSESRPHDQGNGICLDCGLVYFTVRDLADLKRVNEERAFHGQAQLTELRKPAPGWLKNWGDPKPLSAKVKKMKPCSACDRKYEGVAAMAHMLAGHGPLNPKRRKKVKSLMPEVHAILERAGIGEVQAHQITRQISEEFRKAGLV